MLSDSLATTLPAAQGAFTPAGSDRYELKRELGRGGQSVVWVAFDRQLGRDVAFKVPLPRSDGSVSPEAAARFLREAQVTARLDHPNIITVHEIGRNAAGQLFCAMRLVQGADSGAPRTLADAVRAARSLPERLALLPRLLDVANAMAFAHHRGVVHRDLKPDNVVLGRSGETVVLDWGLARVMTEMDEAPEVHTGPATVDGQVFGTPLYMSPEQASGQRDLVDERSDVWSLGVMVFECLTGQAPFARAPTTPDIIEAVRRVPIPSLQKIDRTIPKALAAVVSRALERDLTKRYPNAGALAADLRAFLDGRTVGAYDYSAFDLVRLFVSRNRTAALIGAISVAALVVSTVALARAVRQNRESLAEAFVEKGRLAEGILRWEEAAVWYSAAHDLSPQREDAAASLRVVWPRTRLGSRVLFGHQAAIRALAASPDGAFFVSSSADRTIRVWSVSTGATLRVLAGHSESVNALAVSADGKALYSGGEDDTLRVWNLESGEGHVLLTLPDAVNALALSKDGKTLAIACEDRTVQEVSLETGQARTVGTHLNPVYAVAYSGNGQWLASGSWDGEIQIHGSDGAIVARLTAHSGSVLGLAFGPTGKFLASSGRDTTVRLWDTATWSPTQVLLGNTQKAYGVAWSADGEFVVSAGADGTTRVWAGPSRFPLASASLGRDDELLAVVFLPNSFTLVSGGRRGLVHLRSLDGAKRTLASSHEVGELTELASGEVALQHEEGFAFVRPDLRSTRVFSAQIPPGAPLQVVPSRAAVFTRDGTLAVGSTRTLGHVMFFDVLGGTALAGFSRHEGQVEALAFSPDERLVATVGREGRTLIWDVARRLISVELPREKNGLFDVEFSPDGSQLATAGYDRSIHLYETRGWSELAVLEGHEHGVRAVAFSPDGQWLASGGWDRSVKLWRLADRQLVATLFGHQDQVTDVRFSPDGRRLASSSHDGTIRLWDLARRSEIVRFTPDEGRVNRLLFSRDGKALFYARHDVHRIDLADAERQLSLEEVLRATDLSIEGLHLTWSPRHAVAPER